MRWRERQLPTAKGTPADTPQYKIIQANLQKNQLATQELLIEAAKRKTAIALLQEPYVGGATRMRSYQGVRVFQNSGIGGGTTKAAIAVFDPELDIIQHPQLTTDNIVVVGVRTRAWTITLVSYYFEPTKPIGPYLEHIKKVESKTGPKGLLLGGDANAKSAWWSSLEEDERGTDMSGTLGELGLHVLNTGNTPTFDYIRGGVRYRSHVDVTACSTDLLDLVEDWRVDEGLTCSDHNGITYRLLLQKSKGIHINRTTRVYNTKKANWDQFRKKLTQLTQENNFNISAINDVHTKEDLEGAIDRYTQLITQTCTQTIPNKKQSTLLTLPWWSEKLAELKREVATRKRRIRNAAPARREMVVTLYLKQKEEYETEAKAAQTKSWKEFCCKQDREGLWEGIYRVIGRSSKREEDQLLEQNGTHLDAKSSVRLLAETFYPEDSTENDGEEHRGTREQAERVNRESHIERHDPPFTLSELKTALKSFNPKKAPGADGLTSDICAHAIGSDPELFLALLNKCLAHHLFPKSWKEATVVVLRKPGKESYTNPKSYRPIGLLPVLGKVYEKMLVARLKFHLLPRISTRQYGFMPQKSTEDSLYDLMQYIRDKLHKKEIVTIISLDIEGAFDSAWWPAIRVRLAEEKCPVNLRRVMDSYLSERSVGVRYAGEEHRRETSKGCVQGSIGGPILWNLLLDPLLRNLEEWGDHSQAFADDVVLVFTGKTAQEIEGRANAALEHVRAWGVRNKLKFAPHKTCAMVITRKLKYDTPRLSMGGIGIGMSKEIKILGLTIDNQLTFNTHIGNVCKKAIGIYKQLSRTAKISWGLHPEVIRLIYVATVEPVILYAASAWAPSALKLGVRKQLESVQRGIVQKLCKAYRTVSLNAALVLAGILPLDLRIREAASLYEAKRGVPLPIIADREVEKMASALEAPHPAERENLELGLIDQEQPTKQPEIRIFTDGSKIEGRVGAALSIWNRTSETKAIKLALPQYCTVYQAELLAISRATREIAQHRAVTFGVYSDSMAALQTVINHGCLHPLAVQARQNIKTASLQGKVITLSWVKAHVGLQGNERADELAKGAAMKLKRAPDYDLCPVSFVKRSIRSASLDEWNHRYRNGETASVTKLFFPDAVSAYRIVRKIQLDGVTTQILSGHGGFLGYLNRFKCSESPSCICDPAKEETVPHVLIDCPVYEVQRYNLQRQLDVVINVQNIAQIMIGKKRSLFLRYCVEICSKVIERNKKV